MWETLSGMRVEEVDIFTTASFTGFSHVLLLLTQPLLLNLKLLQVD